MHELLCVSWCVEAAVVLYVPPQLPPLPPFPQQEGPRKIAMRLYKNAIDQHGCRAVPGAVTFQRMRGVVLRKTACLVLYNVQRQRGHLCPTRLCVSPTSVSGFELANCVIPSAG